MVMNVKQVRWLHIELIGHPVLKRNLFGNIQLQGLSSTQAFHVLTGLIVSALLCFFNKEVQVIVVFYPSHLPRVKILYQSALARRWQQSSTVQLSVSHVLNLKNLFGTVLIS